MKKLSLLAALALITAACQNPLTDPAAGGDAPGFRFEADTTALALATSRDAYTLRRTDIGYETEIPFRFRNTASRTVYVVNCNRIVPPLLEKRVDGAWVVAWGAVVPQCLSEPIVIAPGEVYRDTLEVFAGYPESNNHPRFEVDEPAGTYRLVWTQVLWSFDPNEYPFGPEVPRELRTSNEITLSVEP